MKFKALLIWECGQDLGHISNLSFVAKVLYDMGSEIYLCVKEAKNIPSLFEDIPIRVVGFPKNNHISPKRPTASMADILIRLGFDNESQLAKQCQKWQTLYDSIKPDIVVFDYAPTAMLAAIGHSFKKVAVDSTWGLPPPGEPFLPLDIWSALPENWIAHSERTVLNTINAVLQKSGLPMMDFASDIFCADLTLIANYPEFDLYAHLRQQAHYLGPLYFSTSGQLLNLGHGPKKLFGYLKEDRRQTQLAISALVKLHDVEIHLFVPNITQRLRLSLERYNIVVYDQPVALHRQLSKFDLVLCHGGSGTITSAVKSGVPLLIFASQMEQRNVAELVARSGAGLHVDEDESSERVVDKIGLLLTDKFYKDNCKKIRRTVQHANSNKTVLRAMFNKL